MFNLFLKYCSAKKPRFDVKFYNTLEFTLTMPQDVIVLTFEESQHEVETLLKDGGCRLGWRQSPSTVHQIQETDVYLVWHMCNMFQPT